MVDWTFAREFFRRPSDLGSVVPSSRALSEAVFRALDPKDRGPVVELGAGTGPITKTLLEHFPAHRVLAIEPSEHLAEAFSKRFPRIALRQVYAGENLPEILTEWGHFPVRYMVSGLPWTLWSEKFSDPIFRGITASLRDRSTFVTYGFAPSQLTRGGARMRRQLNKYWGDVEMKRIVWNNVPPAVVFRCKSPIREG